VSVETHRAAIAALLAGVADVGKVHDHEPYARAEAAFRELYLWDDHTGQPQLRGWFIRRVRTVETSPHLGRVINSHTWTIRGFMALDDELGTELAFDALIEAIRAAFRADPTLGGANGVVQLAGPAFGVQLVSSTPVMFVGALCHACELSLTTHELL
jgi:hypothetical protein